MAFTLLAAVLASVIAAPSLPVVASADEGAPLILVQQRNDNNRSRGGAANGGDGVDCRSAAGRAVGQTGGQLLSVQPSGNSCVVTVLVPGNGNQRPRKVTVRVPAR
ncbi:hypothetical protein [Rhizobium halophytocola]|uniref:Uncharacterized protein n=1 Tax=Rhizobium halophytocola TaxID=735519 RepID=A0ABS4DYW9_9HYPH|nr:hypothetical protein [Rhizobium halophytocola]MBP1850891.1 hypothetical protein [Rhizobium halophytocola]